MIDTIPAAISLRDRLRQRIRSDGPITFCEWMEAALYDAREGYYIRTGRNRWGKEGDYRTSPERSGLFAATFARYFAQLYERLDSPSEWTIVEAGAGDGSFAVGLLTALRDFFPKVLSATHYVVDEVGPASKARERLEPFAERVSFKPISEITINPGVVFSNELLDAFPVHRVTQQDGQIWESYVEVNAKDDFVWLHGPPSSAAIIEYLERNGIHLDEGQFAEVNLAIEDWLLTVSAQLSEGYVITVDYGAHDSYTLDTSQSRETLRGFRNHTMVEDVLAQPGDQDLTSSVDWNFVRKVGDKLGLKTIAFERQDKFLLSSGLLDQLEIESARVRTDAERLRLSTAAREMILPNGMAASFQVLVQKKTILAEASAV